MALLSYYNDHTFKQGKDMSCIVSKEIAEHTETLGDNPEQEVVSEIKEQLTRKFAEMTHDKIDTFLIKKYDVTLADCIENAYRDDGVIEYFILNRNAYYTKAISAVLDQLDYTKDIQEARDSSCHYC